MTMKSVRALWCDRPTIYWFYYLIGGIYTSFSKRVKCYCFVIHLGILFSNIMWVIGYLITVEHSTFFDTVFALNGPLSGISHFIFVPVIIFYLRREIEEILDFIKTKRTVIIDQNPYRTSYLKNIDITEKNINLARFIIGNIIIFSAVAFLGILFNYKSSSLRNVGYHLNGIPYMDNIDTFGKYCVAYLLEILPASHLAVIAYLEMAFVNMIVGELNNNVIDFCGKIQSFSVTYEVKFGLYSSDLKLIGEFDREIVLFIKEYQVLHRVIKSIGPLIQIFTSLAAPVVFVTSTISFCMLLSKTDMNFAMQMRILVVFNMTALYLHCHCDVGTQLNNMTEEIIYQIYNLPWYSLPPRRRKIVFTFLTQVQRPIIFKAVNLFYINVAMLPKVFRLAYSVAVTFASAVQK